MYQTDKVYSELLELTTLAPNYSSFHSPEALTLASVSINLAYNTSVFIHPFSFIVVSSQMQKFVSKCHKQHTVDTMVLQCDSYNNEMTF